MYIGCYIPRVYRVLHTQGVHRVLHTQGVHRVVYTLDGIPLGVVGREACSPVYLRVW